MKNSKNVYIILTYTGTVLSKIIKFYTGAEFSHVSIALDEDLNEMFSFGRLNPYNPFIGGFVQEGIDIGTFKRFKNTIAEIYSIELTNKQYKLLKKEIKKIEKQKDCYRFNTIGLFAVAFNKRIKRHNCFYCAEFIKYLVDSADLNLGLPDIIKPIDFKQIDKLELKYKGVLRNYKLING